MLRRGYRDRFVEAVLLTAHLVGYLAPVLPVLSPAEAPLFVVAPVLVGTRTARVPLAPVGGPHAATGVDVVVSAPGDARARGAAPVGPGTRPHVGHSPA